jgi:predicted Holliday junction resolvase-like endonuclease
MDDLINHFFQYFKDREDLNTNINELKDISEYNNKMCQKLEENAKKTRRDPVNKSNPIHC